MFNSEKDYDNAIKNAQLHRGDIKTKSGKLLTLNLILMAVLGYAGFLYLQSSKNSLPVSKQAVLGVSETIDDAQMDNEKLMHILKDREDNSIKNSMKTLSVNSSIKSQPSYTEAITRELDDKRSGFKGKIAVVNQKN